ncbi:thioredoxin [Catellatospora methionotrophica]|uniref:Thioredoxin n=1 Tax=Catellatospora methionotrophica TaxID=121620 RepID=A0A8J3LHP2_9ACTN|nr:thioredoxin [Catellatospora methionotrophica]GIG15366.1 thioredoxin [Catellatospora methionotrophica]
MPDKTGPLVEVTDATFADVVLKSERPVVVDFWADWCAPCKVLERSLNDLSEEFGDRLVFAKLDADANPETARAYKVMSMPTLIVFRGGEVVASAVGNRPKIALRQFLETGIGA